MTDPHRDERSLQRWSARVGPLLRAERDAYWRLVCGEAAEEEWAKARSEMHSLWAKAQVDPATDPEAVIRANHAWAAPTALLEAEAQAEAAWTALRCRPVESEEGPVSICALLDQLHRAEEIDEREAIWALGAQDTDAEAVFRERLAARAGLAAETGYDSAHDRELFLLGVEPGWFADLLAELERATRVPYREARMRRNAELATRFKVDPDEVRPAMDDDPSLHSILRSPLADLAPSFAKVDVDDVSRRFFDGIGMDTRRALAEIQDGYVTACVGSTDRTSRLVRCSNVGLSGVLETVDALMSAMHHKYIDNDVPDMVASPDPLWGAAVKRWARRVIRSVDFIVEYTHAPAFETTAAGGTIRRMGAFDELSFVRWCLACLHFERTLCADPAASVAETWSGLRTKYLMCAAPGDDWFGSLRRWHALGGPAALIGTVLSAQLESATQDAGGTLVDNMAAGETVITRVFAPGRTTGFRVRCRKATGAEPSVDPFIRGVTGAS